MTAEESGHHSHHHRNPQRASVVTVFVVMLVVSAAGTFLYARYDVPAAIQPIAFNHRKHVTDNQIECSACHQFYETQAFAGLPTADVCGTCHSEPLGKSEEEKKLVKAIREGQPLAWQPLFRQPAHVFYSHRRHVVVARLKCERCHGDIAQAERPPSHVRRLKMEDCVGCHTVEKVAADCTTCHR